MSDSKKDIEYGENNGNDNVTIVRLDELCQRIKDVGGYSKKDSKNFLRVFTKVVKDSLINNDSIIIKDLVTFTPKWTSARRHYDLTTKETSVISSVPLAKCKMNDSNFIKKYWENQNTEQEK